MRHIPQSINAAGFVIQTWSVGTARYSARPLQQISRLFDTLEPSEFSRGFTERSSNSAPNAASSLCSCRVIADGVQYRRSAARAIGPGLGKLYEGA